MYKIENIPLFRPFANTIRYNENGYKYIIIHLSDNARLDEIIKKLSIMKQDIRRIFIPKVKFKKFTIFNTKDYVKSLKKFGFIVNSARSDLFIKRDQVFSHIYDISMVMNKIGDSFKNKYEDILLQKYFLNYLEGVYDSIFYKIKKNNKQNFNTGKHSNIIDNNKIRVILNYTIDTTQPMNMFFERRKIFVLYKYLLRGYSLENFCDYFILSVVKSVKTINIKLFDKHVGYKLNPHFIASKIKGLFNKIKPENEIIEKQIEKDTTETIKDVKSVIKELKELKVDESRVKVALDFVSSFNHELFQKITKKIQSANSDIEKEAAIAALFTYTVSKNEQQAEVLLKIKDNDHDQNKKNKYEKIVKNIIKRNNSQIIVVPKEKYEKIVTNKLPAYKKVKFNEVVDNKIPINIFEKRKIDFKENLFEDIEKILKDLEHKEFPLYLKKMDVQPYTSFGEVKENKLLKINILLEDENGNKSNISFIIPDIDETGSFTLNGYKKILVNQLVLLPIFYNEEYSVKINTYFSTVTIMNNFYRNRRLFRSYISGLHLPMSVILFIMKEDVEYILRQFGLIHYTVSDKKPRNAKYIIYFQKDKKFLIFDDNEIESRPEALSFFESLNIINWKKIKDISSEDFFNFEIWRRLSTKLSGNKNAPFLLENIRDNLIDPVNREVLKNMGYPTDTIQLFILLCKKITTPRKDTRHALDKQRLRNVEVITQLFYQQLMMAYNAYYSRRKMGDKQAKIQVDTFKVFKEFVNNQLVRVKENICPVEQLSLATRVTYVGIGGIKVADAATLEMRSLDETAFGIIDPIDTPEGGMIGVSQNLANGTVLTDKRGIFGIKPIDVIEGSGVLGVAASFSPFVRNNEPTRMIMATNQAKQATILENAQIPMVQTGYESIFTSLLDEDFVIKSNVEGTVFDIKEGKYIKIKMSDGKIHEIDIRYKKLKSGQAVDCLSEFRPVVKIGDKVKCGDIVAEGGGVRNGVITQGASVLMAWADIDGFTFEDGVVVSEDIVDKEFFKSVHVKTFEIFLYPDSRIFEIVNIGDKLKAGEPLVIFSNNEIFEYVDIDPDEIVDRNLVIRAPYDGEVLDVRIYPNIDISKKNFSKLFNHYTSFLKRKPEIKDQIGNFKLRGERFDGILLEIDFKYYSNLLEGDKLVNRHGNKGTISRIIPKDKMPRTPWGEPIEVLLNPLSIVNRGIVGQLYEIYVGLISWKLGKLFLKDFKYFLNKFKDVVSIMDNTKNKHLSKSLIQHFSEMKDKEKEQIKEMLNKNLMRGIPIIIPPFKEPSNYQIMEALKILDLNPKYSLYIPEMNIKTEPHYPIGYIYLYKVEHMVTKKMGVRSVSSYTPKTMQPPQGKSRGGGQRVGEFDSWCLMSYDAKNLLKEFFGPASDDIMAKQKMLQNILQNGETELITTENSPTREYVLSYLKLFHLTEK